MNEIDRLKQEIKHIISKSEVPEDPVHAQNTLEWMLKLKPDADEALQIAALGHDIERAIESRKIKRYDFDDFDAFKEAHARNSARILKEMIQDHHMPKDLIEEVSWLVSHHEIGGDTRSDLLRDADSLSFFDVNLPLYYEREGWEKSLERCRWGYKRLSPKIKEMVREFISHSDEIRNLLKSVFSLP